jgi:hypothetical protein
MLNASLAERYLSSSPQNDQSGSPEPMSSLTLTSCQERHIDDVVNEVSYAVPQLPDPC